MKVTVYEKPACVGCRFTKRKLEECDIDYDTVDLTEDPDAYKHVTDLGYSSAPVVEVDLGAGASWHWGGFRPSEIEILDHAFGCADPECHQCETVAA
jgi:glutaredoxin-like protein NrdH